MTRYFLSSLLFDVSMFVCQEISCRSSESFSYARAHVTDIHSAYPCLAGQHRSYLKWLFNSLMPPIPRPVLFAHWFSGDLGALDMAITVTN